jgi:hypothetical protein
MIIMLKRLLAALMIAMLSAQPIMAQVDVTARGLAAQARTTAIQGGRSDVISARRILRSAARGVRPIVEVMSPAPTYSEGASGANSTIITSAAVTNGGGTYNTSDTTRFSSNGWFTAAVSGTAGMTDRSLTRLNNSGSGYRRGAHGACVVFGTDGDQFDIAASWGTVPFIVYVTDLTTGLRQRTQANDIVPTVSATSYKKWVFADARPRIIEVCPRYTASSTQPIFRGVNVPATASVFPATFPDEPKIAWLGDSWGDNGGTLNTNGAKLLAPDYFAERLGARSVLSISQAGSGLLNDAAGQGTYYQRAITGSPLGDQIGDLAPSRIGYQDLIFIEVGTINDRAENNAAWNDAAVQAATQTLIASVMAIQPYAVIVGIGPQQTRALTTAQSRFDALKAGFVTGSGGAMRAVWIDNSPAGEPVLFGSASTGNISIWIDNSDQNHLNDVGNANWGRRVATMVINAIAARYGTAVSADDRWFAPVLQVS